MSKISYEWDLETIDENGDIVNHDHSYTLKELNKISRNQRLVLVCDHGPTLMTTHCRSRLIVVAKYRRNFTES